MAYEKDFFGRPKTSNWWNQDMSDAGQGLYADPQTAINTATLPNDVIAQKFAAEAEARKARGGFMENLMDGFASLNKDIDGALSHVPGWGVAKDVGKAAFWPVDKAASGAYWLYSNAVSQPIATLLLQTAKADVSKDNFWGTLTSGDEWADAYGKAEHISPGQAFTNYEKTKDIQTGESGMLSGLFGANEQNLTAQDKADVKRNTERFLYDTDFWRKKDGWKYTVGTGSLDFIFNIGADPTVLGLGAASKVVKAGRAIKIAGQAAEVGATKGTASLLTTGVGKITGALAPAAKTQEQASQATKVNNFFDWTEGKTAAEIAQHPLWGAGRRANPAKEQLSQVLSNTAREDKPLILRFAAGDEDAAAQLVQKSQDTMIQIGRMQDNRVLVDSAKFNTEMAQRFAPGKVGLEQAYKTSPVTLERELLNRQTAVGIHRDLNGVRPMGSAPATADADILKAQEWKSAQSDLTEQQIASLQEKIPYWGQVLGAENLGKGVEGFSPGVSNIFGTVKELYRMGPLALRDANKAADKAVNKLGAGVGDQPLRDIVNKNAPGKFVTRLVRNGFYTPATRIVDSFGERVPAGFINHNDDDAYMRVADMLKRVPGLGAETRLDMIKQYSQAGDKIARSDALDKIHTQVVDHMVGGLNNLDPHVAAVINDMRKVGFAKTMSDLGKTTPTSQAFSAAKATEEMGLPTGKRVDFMQDGENYVIAPLAKTQLSMAEPLLPVKEFGRILSRSSGHLQALRNGGASATDAATALADGLNTVWKASTLLRPGFILRSTSDEQAVSAIKFGIMSSVIGGSKGGANWALNRGQQIKAVVGKGSYTSTTKPGSGILRIVSEADVANAEKLGLPTERLKISNAWPLVSNRIDNERSALKGVEDQLNKLKAKGGVDQDVLDKLADKAVDHRRVIAEHQDYAQALLREAKTSTGRRLGEGTFEHEGQIVPEAFSKEWENPIPRDQITSSQAMETIFARGEAIDTGRLIKTGSWHVVTPDDANHMTSWLDGINKQFRQDDLFRLVAKDPTLREASSWLKTPAGRYHISQLGPRARDQKGTLDAIKQTLDQYLPEGTGLQAKIANGEEVMEHELRGSIAKEDFPAVHGEELKALTAKHSGETASRVVDDIIAKGFHKLSTVPNDVMARQPIYLRAQEARMRTLISQEMSYRASVREAGGSMPEHLTTEDMNKLLEKSDRLARKDISQVVYDPTRTTATEALRFLTPFFSAHVDGLQRWGGIIAEKPQFVGTAAKIYNAPVAANLITDQSGQHVDENGMADSIDPATGKKIRVFVPLDSRMLTLRMPWDTTNVKGVGQVPSGGTKISLNALNTILPGDPWFNPGSGPFVQIAASAIAKQSPAMGDFLQWTKVLPYGPSQNWTDPLLPKYMKDTWNAFTAGDKGNEAYQKAYLAEYQRQVGEHANGGPAPDMKKVASNAKNFMFLQAFSAWASPAQNKDTPLTGSPYQFFLDQYKVLQDIDPKNAQDMFMQRYGKDYFAFTASMSKSMGIGATVSADHVASQYGDLIEKNPDLAGLIVGDVYNKGEFSSSVYAKQMDQLIAGQSVREKVTAQDAIASNQKDLGWQQYNRYMNALDSALIRSGFKSYSDPQAGNFADMKHKIVDMLGNENEAWLKDYGTTQTNKLAMMTTAMKRVTSDEKLMADPMRTDLKVLKTYLAARDELKGVLAQRGVTKLSFDAAGQPTGENADVGHVFSTIQTMLVNSDTRFGDLFHRYLNHDDLS